MRNFTRLFAALAGICLLAFTFSACEKEDSLTPSDETTLRTLDEIVQVAGVEESPFYEYTATGEEMRNILGDQITPDWSAADVTRKFAELVQQTYMTKTGQQLTAEQKSRILMPVYNYRMSTLREDTVTGAAVGEFIGFRGGITAFTPAFDERAGRNYFPQTNVLVATFTDVNDQNGAVDGLGKNDSTFDKECINGPGPVTVENAKYWRVRNRVVWDGSEFTHTSAEITCGRIRVVAEREDMLAEEG